MRTPHPSLAGLILLCLGGCRAPAPPPEAPPAPIEFVRADGQALYDQLDRALPSDPRQREAVCLAGLVQARMLADEPDPRVQQRARRWRIECRQVLVERWVERAEQAPDDDRREAACLSAKGHLGPLGRDDPPAGRSLEALVNRACAPPLKP